LQYVPGYNDQNIKMIQYENALIYLKFYIFFLKFKLKIGRKLLHILIRKESSLWQEWKIVSDQKRWENSEMTSKLYNQEVGYIKISDQSTEYEIHRSLEI
jgi:hypothetical protein